jgi:DNA-binding GntR family transcriptional regulator
LYSCACLSQIAAEHTALLSALRSGRKGVAVAAWKEHLDSAERFFLGLIAERDQ